MPQVRSRIRRGPAVALSPLILARSFDGLECTIWPVPLTARLCCLACVPGAAVPGRAVPPGRRFRARRRPADPDLRRHRLRRAGRGHTPRHDRAGDERTIEQDPAFTVRIIADIADKALSSTINDPTTAVQALDHLSNVMRLIGTTDLSRSRWHAGSTGRAGLLIPARSWEDAASHGQDPTASSIMPLRSGPSWRRREPASISSARIRCSGAGSRRGTAAPPRRSGPR